MGPPLAILSRACSRRARRIIAATSTRSTPDAAIRALRPPKPLVDPWRPHGVVLEVERTPVGLERALTVFLAGAECPFTCSFCDLWRYTLDGPTPAGALPRQLARALASIDRAPPFPERLKLYNASNFFDRRAVPQEDLPRLAALAAPFRSITVESHAGMVGPLAIEFSAMLEGRLEVAIGLETIHPAAAAALNKRLDLPLFDRAADFLRSHDIDLRVFVLLGVPHIAPAETIDWTVRSVEYAAARGAQRVSIIPVRGGNGEMERLQSLGEFVPPRLAQLERALEQCLPIRTTVVTADLWDVDRLPACESCRTPRTARIRAMNLGAGPESPPRVSCLCA